MDRIFIEEINANMYRLAAIDRHRIFSAQNPATLATVFECSNESPTRDDDAQIFYAMSPSIDGDNIFGDLLDNHHSHKLNTWSINVKDSNINNIFMAVAPLDHDSRIKLYSERHNITPKETVTSDSPSLFSLVAFANKQSWKTGILQRCLDCLVFSKYRKNAEVYSIIDEEYRRLMRFKLETEIIGIPNYPNAGLIIMIRSILELLGLRNSRDTSIFRDIPESVGAIVTTIRHLSMITILTDKGSLKDTLSEILFLWSGSKVINVENGYKLEIDPNVTKALSYMQPFLQRPKTLTILETHM